MAFQRTVLFSALLALAAASMAQPQRPAPAAKAAPSAATASDAPAEEAAPSPLVQDKFRKFQKEMARGGGAAAAAAQGADDSAPGAAAKAEEPASQPGIISFSLQLLLGLAIVLVLAVASIRGLKRLQGRMLSRPGKDGAGGDIFEVLETCHLGTQQRIVALRIQDEVGIIGVTQQGISLLTVLKQPAEEVRRARIGSGNSAAFSDNLNKLLERFKKPKRVSDLLDETKGG